MAWSPSYPEYNILAWHWADIGAEITKKLPGEPTFRSADFMARVSPLPLLVIASTSDEYVTPETTRALFSEAREPEGPGHNQCSGPQIQRQYRRVLPRAPGGRELDPATTPMNSTGADVPDEGVRPSRVKQVLAYIFATACLVWVFHNVHLTSCLSTVSIANWWFVALAIIIDVLTYVLQGMRWKLLLAPVGCLSTLRATQGIYAGLFTNEVVPLRFGELVRAFLVSRWLSSGVAEVVPSMVVERFSRCALVGGWHWRGCDFRAVTERPHRSCRRARGNGACRRLAVPVDGFSPTTKN